MQMEWNYVGAVVISGLVIVFVALILLIIAVSIMGAIFKQVKKSGSKKETKSNAPAGPAAPAPVKAAPVPQILPAADDNDEIIAVIAAAVAAMSEESGKPLRIKGIKPVGGRVRTNAWASAAAGENTRSF